MTLSNKQRVFIDEYLICLNASEAARRAGYNGKSNVVGSQLLANLSISEEITQRLQERHLSADAVLARLADMARSDIADFTGLERLSDLTNEEYRGKTHVIKRFKRRKYRPKNGDPFEEIELELYPADVNLERVGKVHGLFNNGAGESDDKPFIVKVVYGDRNPSTSSGHSQRANDTSTPTTPEASPGD